MSVIFVGLVLFLLTGIVRSQTDGKGTQLPHFQFECQKVNVTFGDDLKTAIRECYIELAKRRKAEKRGEVTRPDACYSACKLEKLKAVHDGKIDLDNVNTSVENTFPKSVHTEMKSAFNNCSQLITTKLDKKLDCNPYAKFAYCQSLFIKTICKNDKWIET